MKTTLRVLALGALSASAATAPAASLTVEADKPGARINPAMWGVFFEDINFAADGGLYAELVKNRSFEFPDPLMGWAGIERPGAAGSLEVRRENPCSSVQSHYLRFVVTEPGDGFGVSNEGFRGIGVRRRAAFNFSLEARAVKGKPALRIQLVAPDGRELASARVAGFSPQWKPYTASLAASATEPRAHLNVVVEGRGTLDVDMVSLFPAATWKHRPNGLRADLVQMLADLQPGFLRFPGGCIVEGRDLENRYQWKNTIGDPRSRRLMLNRWNTEFRNHPTPDYFQSFGLGFFEFFQLCEDLGARPLPILNCGMACQYNTGQLEPLEQLDPYLQDALDLVEFAKGPVTSAWGAKRAAMGHRAPFKLDLLGIGNEQWGPQYIERYARFAQVLKAKHPEVRLVAAAGPDPSGERFDFLWSRLRELKADLVDEHFYRPPEWFLNNVHRYDAYDRSGPKVFAGEYASHVPNRANNLLAALASAAVMTGFERNADVVRMAAYAPLFAHADAWQWRPNLIWFDNLRVMGTPDYYVQQLFSRNRGDVVLPVAVAGLAFAPNGPPPLHASASRDAGRGDIILKVVNTSTNEIPATVILKGVTRVGAKGTEILLTGTGLQDENSLDNPTRVAPKTGAFAAGKPEFSHTFPAISLTVLRVKAKE